MVKYLKGCIALMLFAFMFTILSLPLYAQTIGYEIPSNQNTYTNSESVNVTKTEGDNKTIDKVWGIYSNHTLEYFNNTESGSISASAKVGSASGDSSNATTKEIFGTYFNSTVDNFINSGSISASAKVGSASGNGSRVEIDVIIAVGIEGNVTSFTNEGNISASAQAGNASGVGSQVEIEDIIAVGIGGNVTSFTNEGSITASVQVGDASGVDSEIGIDDIIGIEIGGDVNSFTNEGDITISAQAGDASGNRSIVWMSEIEGVSIGNNVGSFVNSGNVTVSAQAGDASGNGFGVWISIIRGVSIGGNVTSFTNKGDVSVSVQAGDVSGNGSDVWVGGIYGVSIGGNVTSFINEGNISATAQAGSASGNGSTVSVWIDGMVGVEIEGNVTSFTNEGNITASAQVGSASGNASTVGIYSIRGVSIEGNVTSFTNEGNISASAQAGDASGNGSDVSVTDIQSVLIEDNVTSFTNEGNISASAQAGDASGDNVTILVSFWGGTLRQDYNATICMKNIYGIFFGSTVGNFTNSGNITASVQAGSASGDSSKVETSLIIGVIIEGNVTSFTNSGNISATAQVGDASGNNATVGVSGIGGVIIEGNVTSFTNEGNISVSAQAGNASGDSSNATVEGIYGAYFDSTVGNFTNSGNITASAQVGSASGANATAKVSKVFVLYFNDGADKIDNKGKIVSFVSTGNKVSIEDVSAVYIGGKTTIENHGDIVTTIKGGKDVKVDDISGIKIENATSVSVKNTGKISVSIDVSSGSVNNTAGIYIFNSNATIFSSGPIYLYSSLSNAENAEIRTLRIENSSKVTFADRFSIVFGNPGITKRPIYVGSNSTLNLNDTTLVVYAGDDLSINHPYSVIESQGTVNGTFGGLEESIPNPDIHVSWHGDDRGENATVIFRYQPQHSPGALSVFNAYRNFIYTFSRIADFVLLRGGSSFSFAERDKKPVLLASISNATSGLKRSNSAKNKFSFLFSPYYFYIDADNLKYGANNWGFQLGLERRMGDRLKVGIFGGLGWSKIDFKQEYDVNSEEQNHKSVGVYGLYRWDRWFAGVLSAYCYTDHDYDGYTGPNFTIKEKDKYDSYGLYGQVLGGYEFEPAVNFGIALYSGFSYSKWHADSHTTKADNPRWNKTYEEVNKGFFNAMLGVNLARLWIKDEKRFLLEGGLRIEQALTDNDILIKQSIPGIGAPKVEVKEEIANTSLIGKLGLSFSKGRIKFGVSFDGEYNKDYQAWSGLVDLKVSF